MLDQILRNLSYLHIGFVLCIGWLLYGFARRAVEERRIKELGGRGARRKGWAPYALDLLYDALTSGAKNQVLEFWLRNFRTYGNPSNPWTVEAGDGPRRVILTADPENIKAILATQFHDYGKGENFNKDWHDFLGDSIFTTDGEQWHNSRQLIRPQFIKDRLSDIKVFEKHVDVLLPILGGNGQAVDVADLFFRYTLDVATDFLLGRSVDSLTHQQARFAQAFNEVLRLQSIIARLGYWNKLMPRGKFYKELKMLNEFVNTFIDDTLRLSPEELQKTTKSDEGYTFLHALAAYTRDRSVLRDQLVAVLLAGRDTTACTLSWTFYELSRHPQVVMKLRQEILHQVGTNSMPTYADLKNMRYLQVCCIPISVSRSRLNLHVAHNERGVTTLPRGTLQHSPCAEGHHAPSWRRSRWQPAHGYPQRQPSRLQHTRHATPPRPIPAAIFKLPARRPIRTRTLGALDSQELAVYSVQRRP